MTLLTVTLAVAVLVRRLLTVSRIAHSTWRRPGPRWSVYETGSHT